MKRREDVFLVLTEILKFYEAYRNTLRFNEGKSIKRTLETYSDFYDWIYCIGKFKEQE
jgi:hypothetical protein